MARVGAFCYLPALLRDLGTEPGPIFARFGLDESNFANPDAEISAVVRIGLLVVCSRETGCPHFGLLLGQQFNFSALGPVGFLMRNAPDVRTALNELAVFFHLHTPVASVKLQEGEESSSLIYETTVTTVEGMELVQDAAIAAEWNVMRTLCGPDWLPSEDRPRYRRSRDAHPGAHAGEQTVLPGGSGKGNVTASKNPAPTPRRGRHHVSRVAPVHTPSARASIVAGYREQHLGDCHDTGVFGGECVHPGIHAVGGNAASGLAQDRFTRRRAKSDQLVSCRCKAGISQGAALTAHPAACVGAIFHIVAVDRRNCLILSPPRADRRYPPHKD